MIAGRGFRDRLCRESIIQFERLRALSEVKEARLSGTSVNRFDDKSREWRVLAKGDRLVALIVVNELSARLRCLRNLHFVTGRIPRASRFEELVLR